MQEQNSFKSGYVSIIGEPNVGKSTLLNALMGEKIAIVTPKPQTTRNRITGILTTDSHQIIFLDTPGVLTPKYRLHDQMVKAAYTAITDADLVLYMIDVSRLNSGIEEKILDELKKAAQQVILVINKIDLIPNPTLLPIIASYQGKFPFLEIIPISATAGDGVLQLRESIVKHIPEGPAYFPPDQLSDLPERFFVSETIREKVFLRTSQEIPYASSVVVEEFKERPNGKIYISAMLYVERQSQKGILVGKGGRTIKRIGQLARAEIEQFLETTVFLDLRVSVKADWRRDERKLKDMGYF
jgi:GTP-binding protein Era